MFVFVDALHPSHQFFNDVDRIKCQGHNSVPPVSFEPARPQYQI